MSTSDARPFVSSTPRLYGFVIASIGAGMIAGFLFGSRTGVKDALEAGASIDAQTLSKALSWKPEIASSADERRQIAQLLDEVRSVRAQVESMRHGGEALRVAERLRASEAAREANEKALAAASARIERLEARLDLLEGMKIDPTPTGAVPKAERDERNDARPAPERPKAQSRRTAPRNGG